MLTQEEEIRRVAIGHHDHMAPEFQSRYVELEKSRFANAFTYGRAKIDKMVDDLFRSLPKGAKILDVGSGTGEHLKRAIGHGLQATGVEPAPGMREFARSNVPQAELVDGVATKLPFPDAQFDAVILIEVLRYLHPTEVEQALREARRVLRPGGKILATLVNRWALDGFYLLYRGRQLFKSRKFDEKDPYCLFFTPGEAERELRKAGFEKVTTDGRMLAPLRIAYRLDERLGGKVAAAVERLDDSMHQARWPRAFAGHLIVTGEAP